MSAAGTRRLPKQRSSAPIRIAATSGAFVALRREPAGPQARQAQDHCKAATAGTRSARSSSSPSCQRAVARDSRRRVKPSFRKRAPRAAPRSVVRSRGRKRSSPVSRQPAAVPPAGQRWRRSGSPRTDRSHPGVLRHQDWHEPAGRLDVEPSPPSEQRDDHDHRRMSSAGSLINAGGPLRCRSCSSRTISTIHSCPRSRW